MSTYTYYTFIPIQTRSCFDHRLLLKKYKDVVLWAHNVETGLVGHFLAKQPDHRAAKNHKKQCDQSNKLSLG